MQSEWAYREAQCERVQRVCKKLATEETLGKQQSNKAAFRTSGRKFRGKCQATPKAKRNGNPSETWVPKSTSFLWQANLEVICESQGNL